MVQSSLQSPLQMALLVLESKLFTMELTFHSYVLNLSIFLCAGQCRSIWYMTKDNKVLDKRRTIQDECFR